MMGIFGETMILEVKLFSAKVGLNFTDLQRFTKKIYMPHHGHCITSESCGGKELNKTDRKLLLTMHRCFHFHYKNFFTYLLWGALFLVAPPLLAWEGKIFSIESKKVTIATMDSSATRPGMILYMLRDNKQIGYGKVTGVFHSRVEMRMLLGQPIKGLKVIDVNIGKTGLGNEDVAKPLRYKKLSSIQANKDLLNGAEKCDLEKIEKALAAGAEVNATAGSAWDDFWESGVNTVFDPAIIKVIATNYCHHYPGAQTKIVKLLIDAGADVNFTNHARSRHTALMLAAQRSSTEVVKLLLDAGADLTMVDAMGMSVISYAIRRLSIDKFEMMKFLIARGAPVNVKSMYNGSSLMSSLEAQRATDDFLGLTGDFRYLNVSKAIEILQSAGVTKESKLMDAANTCDLNAFKEALSAGAEVNERNIYGHTPLIAASASTGRGECRAEFVKALIAAGAKLEVPDNSGKTALINTVTPDTPEVTKALLNAGANPNARDKYGKTALIEAILARTNRSEIIKHLLINKADVNLRDNDGKTALMHAIIQNKVDTLKALLAAGADVNITDKMGNTAMIYAAEAGSEEVVQLLLEANATPDVKSGFGYSPLMWAAYKGHINIVKILIAAGVDVNVAAATGETALKKATQEEHEKIIMLLKDAGAKE